MSFRVLGTGMYVPPRVVTNDDLSQFLETNDEWITQRVGVKERHISTNETAADMGAKAARAALENRKNHFSAVSCASAIACFPDIMICGAIVCSHAAIYLLTRKKSLKKSISLILINTLPSSL